MIYEFKPRQDLHGYAKPWPGGGGKNLFDQLSYPWASGSVVQYHSFPIENGTYTFSSDIPESTSAVVFVLAGEVSSGAATGTNGVTKNTPRTITVTDGYYTVASRYYEDAPDPKKYNFQMEAGSSATAWTPYENVCPVIGYDITGIGTIYGGVLDSNTGKVLIKYDDTDLGALTWVYNSNYGFYSNADTISISFCSNDRCRKHLQLRAIGIRCTGPYRNFSTGSSGPGIGIKTIIGIIHPCQSLLANDDRFTVAADFKAAMDGVKFVYELATPVELTLTQEQINELIAQMGEARNFGSRTNMLNTWMKLAQGFPVSEEELHMLRPSMRLPDDVVLRPTFEDTPLPEPDPVPDVVDTPAAEPEENITESEES